MQATETVSYTSNFPIAAQELFELLQYSGTLVEITRGSIAFDTSVFPKRWQVGKPMTTKLTAFGFIPLGAYTITFTEINPTTLTLRTREHGGIVKDWVHTMKVTEFTEYSCLYTDTVEIKAGALTGFAASYAMTYYKRRHERLKKLIASLNKQHDLAEAVLRK